MPDEPATPAPPDVSSACLEGKHKRCTGRVALLELRDGRRFVRCACPICDHPEIRSMPLKH